MSKTSTAGGTFRLPDRGLIDRGQPLQFRFRERCERSPFPGCRGSRARWWCTGPPDPSPPTSKR